MAEVAPSRRRAGNRIGTIHTVGTGNRFVLVEAVSLDTAASASEGQELRSASPDPESTGGVSVLRVARERRPPFIVADVLSGQPRPGDEVYYVVGGTAPVTSPAPAPLVDPSPVPATLFPPPFRTSPATP